jgi:hypothetical protein
MQDELIEVYRRWRADTGDDQQDRQPEPEE